MAWTTPRTWVAGEKPTAATLNTHIRDNLAAIGDVWTSYTPSWTAATTNPAIGNGTRTGSYMQAGKLVAFKARITMGSTTTYGSGTWRVSLPVNALASTRFRFNIDCYDDSLAAQYGAWAVWDSSISTCALVCPSTTAGNADRSINATAPFTWATSDILTISGLYEAA